jgi:hypothetical protein
MQIQLKVTHHGSGRYTLMRRDQNEISFSDVQDVGLFGNEDAGGFYKRVAALLGRLSAEGHVIDYDDSIAPPIN